MKLTLIIPTVSRPHLLEKCLESALGQRFSKEEFEVIVVSDGCKDASTEIVIEKFKKSFPNFKYFKNNRRCGPAAARNLGLSEARGEIIAFTDDDCELDQDWVGLAIEAHSMHPHVAVIGGHTKIKPYFSKVLVGQLLSNGAIRAKGDRKEEVIFFPTCNVTFKKEVFDRYRFNEDFPLPAGEDLDFCWRLYQDGFRFMQNHGMKVLHDRSNDFRSFFRQAYYYGRGNFLVQYIHMNHPLLKEVKTTPAAFWFGTILNVIKIPRFAYGFTRRAYKEYRVRGVFANLRIFYFFILHKIFYIFGNAREFFEIRNRGHFKKQINASSKPKMLIVDITHGCNLTCRICDIYKTQKNSSDLDFSFISSLLREAKKLNIPEIALSGGEPLLRPDIFKIFSLARELGISNLGVLTNGLLVSKYFNRLKPFLLDNTISLVVSFDSLRPEVHNYIRNSYSAWQQTNQALTELSMLKKKHPKVNFNVICIILDHNLEELPQIAKYIKELGANSLQFQPLLSNNLKMAKRADSEFFISEKRISILDNIIDDLIVFKRENKVFVLNSENNLRLVKKYFRGDLGQTDVTCRSARDTILVSNQGECTTCFSQYGNIKRTSLSKILCNPSIERARADVAGCKRPCLLPCFCDN